MTVLALDTALDACAAALLLAGGESMARSELIGRGHAERLMPMVESLMRDAGLAPRDLTRVAVTIGPGSFTGIRVGLSAARGLALALGIPAVGVSTLAGLAASVPAGRTAAVVDARRGELYVGFFDGGEPIGEPRAVAAATLAEEMPDVDRLVGTGAQLLADALAAAGRPVPEVVALPAPDILGVARLGAAAALPDAAPKPLYLRAPDAKPQDAFRVARR
jgi:tRNA threonylcarbamoyladenosine biosynthesis protein TsaB